MEYNGGSVVAMVGKNCVAIASDLRLGNQALTIATNFEKVRQPTGRRCRRSAVVRLRATRRGGGPHPSPSPAHAATPTTRYSP